MFKLSRMVQWVLECNFKCSNKAKQHARVGFRVHCQDHFEAKQSAGVGFGMRLMSLSFACVSRLFRVRSVCVSRASWEPAFRVRFAHVSHLARAFVSRACCALVACVSHVFCVRIPKSTELVGFAPLPPNKPAKALGAYKAYINL